MSRIAEISLTLALAAMLQGRGAVAQGMAGGVNLSGMEIGLDPGKYQTDYTTPTLQEMQYYCTARHLCLFRLPINLERLEPRLLQYNPVGEQPLDTAYVGLIKRVLANAASVGAHVIIDMHDYGGYFDMSQWKFFPLSATGTFRPAYFAWAWKQLALQLRGSAALAGYDLMNEPTHQPTPDTWPTSAQLAATYIRQVDQTTTLYVEGDCNAAASSWTSCGNNSGLAIKGGSIIYEAHVYGDRDNSGTHYSWLEETQNGVSVSTISNRVQGFATWCHQKHYACMIGEIGVGRDNPGWNTELANGLGTMAANGMVGFTYWAGGPWWGSYPLSVEPTGLNAAVKDALQMAVLAAYGK